LRILVISNLYPPFFVGGYELGCSDVVDSLRARGHEVTVLTSTYGCREPATDGHVRRLLRIEPFGPGWAPRRMLSKPSVYAVNGARTREAIRELRPHVLYQWNPAGISLAPALAARDLGIPVAYYVSDEWMMHWEHWPSPALRRGAQAALGHAFGVGSISMLDLGGAQFASRHLHQATTAAGRGEENCVVIPWGVDTRLFAYRPRRRGSPLRLLYAGQIGPHKGLHTAIQAVRLLADRLDVELTVAGGSIFPRYERQVRALADHPTTRDRVHFVGNVPRPRAAALHHEHDIFVFPSIWDEPFSLALLEAMAAGTVVVGTSTGGSGEVLAHEQTGLVFARSDAAGLAGAIARAAADETLCERLRKHARRTVQQQHELSAMIDRIEAALRQRVASAKSPLAAE